MEGATSIKCHFACIDRFRGRYYSTPVPLSKQSSALKKKKISFQNCPPGSACGAQVTSQKVQVTPLPESRQVCRVDINSPSAAQGEEDVDGDGPIVPSSHCEASSDKQSHCHNSPLPAKLQHKKTHREKKKKTWTRAFADRRNTSARPLKRCRSGQVRSGQVGNTFQMTHAGTDRKWRGTRDGHAFLSILTVSLFTALPLQMKQPTLLENLCILPV